MSVKKCGTCREVKSVDEFVARRDKPDKYLPRCKACRGAESKGGGLKRTPMKRTSAPMKRTRLNPVSDKRREVNAKRKEAMLAHFGKSETWKCMGQDKFPHKCFGEINGHEILSRARSGQSDANLLDMNGIITICNWLNSYIEDNPTWAHEMGFTKHSWE
jgi:hypothetical protein